MLSAAQRQAKLARKAKARKQWKQRAKLRAVEEMRRARRRDDPDRALLIVDKREELYGEGDADGGYSEGQIAHVNAIVDAYTPDEFRAALALAKALKWSDLATDGDNYDERVEQRRQQGRGLLP